MHRVAKWLLETVAGEAQDRKEVHLQAIGFALISIAEELEKMNDRVESDEQNEHQMSLFVE